ncbi:SRPBCC family protein [Flavobacterium aquicola]|uniref:Uncharacterized protein YndB with AHSA1/START domain n=1 Tax=Flavobacterium aquicola TaxID=1682742 RepID=A0A3E0ERD8_9FLAO|nr:SRPBCC domain-containing protein [Flavobacterium aquicola]REH00783.1 uncharacterized protein YndB with AHSA1/START domain [Flavobacterium aquicola]
MNTNLTFDFTVDKKTSTVYVKKEFAAALNLVWDAYTKAELLDKWWGPKPWFTKTKSMEFKEGGRRLYAMCGPEGQEHWALADFTSISPKTNFQFLSGFCDNEGNINNEIPRSEWNIDFDDKENTTFVTIAIKHKSLDNLEQMLAMGFKEGFTVALNGLDELFANTKN